MSKEKEKVAARKEEEEDEEEEQLMPHTDRLAIAPKQIVSCDVCKTEYKTSETPCFFCFPPFGLDFSQYQIVACDKCWQRIRWDVDSKTHEVLLFLTREEEKE